MISWNDFVVIALGAAFIYKLLFPKQEPKVSLTPREVARVLEIQSKPRPEFSAVSWIVGRQEFPQVRGRLWQFERRMAR